MRSTLFPVLKFRFAALTLASLMLAACSGTGIETSDSTQSDSSENLLSGDIESLLEQAKTMAPEQAATIYLEVARLMLDNNVPEQALSTVNNIPNLRSLDPELRARLELMSAEASLALDQPDLARQSIELLLEDNTTELSPQLLSQARSLRADSYALSEQYIVAVRERIELADLLNSEEQTNNQNKIWELLSYSSEASLSQASNTADSYELRGWLELARIMNANQISIKRQINALNNWRNTWTQHSAAESLPDALSILYTIWDERPQEIALVIPVQEPLGKAIMEGFLSAYYDALAQGDDVPQVKIYDTSYAPEALVLYDQAVDDGIDFIIGPLQKSGVRRILRSSRPMPVPTLALNYGDLGQASPRDLYQFGLAPEDEIIQAANTAWQSQHRNAAVLTPAGEDYLRIQDTFVNYWQSLGGRIVSVDTYSNSRDFSPVIKRIFNIDKSEQRAQSLIEILPRQNVEFMPRRRQDLDFIFLLANPIEGRQIKPTLSFHFAGEVPVYAMPGIYDGGTNPAANRDLNGVIFSDAPWILTDTDPLKNSVTQTWAAASGPVKRLRAMGIDSYRLYLRLEQMQQFPYVTLKGATGTLSMGSEGRIHRSLQNAVIENGEAIALAP
ncbi:MAG: penicillin-binding protein activator [Pseudohongiellaceae bacterium]|nr:penicillin-binding protein activator [Pseudohongiellaceae bacterium]